jgi:membrane protein YdbS with pleckstrin-like domain
MAPAVALIAVASLLVWTGRWYLDELSDFADYVGGLAMFALAWAVWPAVIAIFLYRTVTFTYRLTDRAVLVDFGFFCRPVPPMPLKDIISVTVGGGWLARRLRVGWIEVRSAAQTVRLKGVRNPYLFAEKIRQAAAESKQCAVISNQ